TFAAHNGLARPKLCAVRQLLDLVGTVGKQAQGAQDSYRRHGQAELAGTDRADIVALIVGALPIVDFIFRGRPIMPHLTRLLGLGQASPQRLGAGRTPFLVARELPIENFSGPGVGVLQGRGPIAGDISYLRGSHARIYPSHCSRHCCVPNAAHRCLLRKEAPAKSETCAPPSVNMPLVVIRACGTEIEHRRPLSASVLPTSVAPE